LTLRPLTLTACFGAPMWIAAYAAAAIGAGVSDAGATIAADARIANGWRVLRAVDCARCHGRDFTGLAAPSIVAYARSQSRETFVRMVLDGDPIRGMPGYVNNAYVVENLDDIYQYFVARANDEIGPAYRPPVRMEPR
jgi:hypothetical protein